jgi:hypothetical protein
MFNAGAVEIVEAVTAAGEFVDGVLEGECKTKSGVQAEWVKPQGWLPRGKRQGRLNGVGGAGKPNDWLL